MKDKSIFQGWIETDDHRFEEIGNLTDIWGAYEKQTDMFGDSFIFVGYMTCESSDAQTLTDTFLNMIYHEEYLKTLKKMKTDMFNENF